MEVKDANELLSRELTVFVNVHQLEGRFEVLLGEELVFVHRSCQEFRIVNQTISINVEHVHYLLELGEVAFYSTHYGNKAFSYLLNGEEAVIALVSGKEDLSKSLHLVMSLMKGQDESHDSLLEDCTPPEGLKCYVHIKDLLIA